MEEPQETNVVTVTLSPSLDRTLVTHYLAVGYHNRTQDSTRLDPAGEGVNIARALHRLIQRAHAIVLIGDDATGRSYQALVADEGFNSTLIRVAGRTPSNTIILDTGNHTETQILEEREGINRDDILQVVHALKQAVNPGDIVVFAGPLPPGVPDDTYAWLTEVAKEAGAQVAILTGGDSLREALTAEPDMIALSEIQCEGFFNYPVRTREHAVESARRLQEMGARIVLIEMREAGEALLVSEEGEWYADLKLGPDGGTTSGIWDAFVAGVVAGRISEKSHRAALELAAAAGAYTALHVGHEFGMLPEVRSSKEQVAVYEIDELSDEYLNAYTDKNKREEGS